MDRNGFLKLLQKKLYPVLRAEGFKGSGSTLRRVNDPVIQLFNVQASTSGDHCFLNLGAHLLFLGPCMGGPPISPEKYKDGMCLFSERIESPPGPPNGWAYCETPEMAEANVDFIISEWDTQARPFFRRYGSYPDSFQIIVNEADPEELHPSRACDFARIALHLGLKDRAIAIARIALVRVPETATILHERLVTVLECAGAAQ